MSPGRRRDVHRPISIILAIFLLWTIRVGHSRPHGRTSVRVEDSDAVPPAMAAFFRGTDQPKTKNATESVWDVGRFEPAAPDRGSRAGRRAVLLAIGVGCGVVGAGLLVAGAVVYVVQGRKPGPGSGRRSLPEVRLGSPSPARSNGP